MEPINAVFIKKEHMPEDTKQEYKALEPVSDRSKPEPQQKSLVLCCEQSEFSEVVEKLRLQSNLSVGSDVSGISIPNESNITPVVGRSLYTCSTCLQYFSALDLLIRHVFSHDLYVDSPLYICEHCGEVFFNLLKLHIHNFQESKETTIKESSLIELSCVFCADTFLSWCSLTKHVFTHVSAVSNPLYICTYCSEVFEDMAKLNLHKFSRRIYCDNIHFHNQFSTAELQNHAIEAKQVIIHSCSNTVKYKSSYHKSQSHELLTICKLHKMTCMQSNYVKNRCIKSVCDAKCSTDLYKQSFTRHQSPQVQERINYSELTLFSKDCGKAFMQTRNHETNHADHSNEHLFCCELYRKSFTQAWSFREHQRIHSAKRPLFCEICGKFFAWSIDLKRHHKIHSRDRQFSGEICGRMFIPTEHLKGHQMVHSGKRPVTCITCGKSFAKSGYLKVHQRIHLGVRPFSCEICGKTFAASWHLKDHMRIHSGIFPFLCDVCGKCFKRCGTFKKHRMIHSSERPFSCDFCGKSFTGLENLKKHRVIHSGERLFSCEVCEKSFTHSGDLTKHQRVHSDERPYSCKVCGKSFRQAGDFRKHSRIHSGERRFSCEVCGKRFTQSGACKSHQRIHSGERPFSCKICGKSFTRSSDLKRHQRSHYIFL